MSNLTRNSMVPQIRCRAMTGGNSASPFRYEVNVLGRWIASNYQFARWVVDSGHWLARGQEGTERHHAAHLLTPPLAGFEFAHNGNTYTAGGAA